MNNDKWILVETEVKYRMHYLIKKNDLVNEVNAAKVVLEEIQDSLNSEFSQEFIGETPIGEVLTLSTEEAIKLFKEKNDYLEALDDDRIIKIAFMEKTES